MQVVEVILMVMEQFELHYCLMVDLKNLEVPGDLSCPYYLAVAYLSIQILLKN